MCHHPILPLIASLMVAFAYLHVTVQLFYMAFYINIKQQYNQNVFLPLQYCDVAILDLISVL